MAKITFGQIGLHSGDALTFTPTGARVEVHRADKNTIVTDKGEIYTTSAYCVAFMPSDKRNASNSYQGPRFFSYNGKTLCELFDEYKAGTVTPSVSDNSDDMSDFGENPNGPAVIIQTGRNDFNPSNEGAAIVATRPHETAGVPSVSSTVTPDNSDKGGELARIIRELAAGANSAPQLDIEAVASIVKDEVAKAVANIETTPKTAVTVNSAPAVTITGVTHPQFSKVLFWVNNSAPVYLYGPAGTGKTTLCKQVADALSLPFFAVSSLQTKFEFEGFVNAGGVYEQTDFYKAFTQGGLFLLDEMDNTAAEVLVAFNNALANRFYTFPGEIGRVEAHPNFRVIAAGNTKGRGADSAYSGRFQLDASSLDRFKFISVDYSKEIEMAMAGGDSEIVTFIHKVREAINAAGLSYTASTRAINGLYIGKQAVTDGILTDSEVLADTLCGGWDKSDLQQISRNVYGTGRWFDALKALAAA